MDNGGTSERRLAVLVSGASGLIGSRLVSTLRARGHRVAALVRRPPGSGTEEVFYDPVRGTIDSEKLASFDAVVHLGGASIAEGRWTPARRAEIKESRVRSTHLLVDNIAHLRSRPPVLVCASAIGFYGSRGDAVLAEDAAGGIGFLADVCRDWEAAASASAASGAREVRVRIGIVLSRDGGALARMLPLFRLGLGGRIGSGRQYMSWIALDDLVEVFCFCLTNEAVAGPVNGTAPEPVTNSEFTRALARAVRRPAFLPAPALAMRLMLGQMADELLLGGARVVPRKLEQAGFRFRHPRLDAALAAVLG